jgi:phage/plasmid primase-like uncharacterized protein
MTISADDLDPIIGADEMTHDCTDEYEGECVMCGNPEATVRFDDQDGESEPLCADCWYRHDHQADQMYADQQFAFYNKPEEEQ